MAENPPQTREITPAILIAFLILPNLLAPQFCPVKGLMDEERAMSTLAVKEKGPAGAIRYCNVHATPLVDSLSKEFNCGVSRLSLKNRNPLNSPMTQEEEQLMNEYLNNTLEGNELKDTLLTSDGHTFYYRPIMLGMEGCLSCHGKPGEQINEETVSALADMYPADKAVDYQLGDFRGAWRVAFSSN
jgi:hypothetical protein